MEKYEERQEAQRLADLEEAQQMLGEQLEQDTLTAEDITDLRLVDSEYMSGTRTKIYDFDCKVKGEANRLQYILFIMSGQVLCRACFNRCIPS